MVSCVGFMVFGLRCVWFGALQDLPRVCFAVCVPSLFFFCFGLFADDVFPSFSLSLRRWGNPNPIWGLGFPLWSLRAGRGLRLQPALRAPHFPQGFAPAPVFFFFPSRRRRSLVCWLVLWRSVAFLFGFFVSLWWWVVVLGLSWLCLLSLPFCCLHARVQVAVGSSEGGRGTIIPHPIL